MNRPAGIGTMVAVGSVEVGSRTAAPCFVCGLSFELARSQAGSSVSKAMTVRNHAIGARTFLFMPLGIGGEHPGGMTENSPAFQRWDDDRITVSPVGTAEPAILLSSLRDLADTASAPSVDTL